MSTYVSLLIMSLFLFAGTTFATNKGKTLFQTRCAACHSIGQGRRIGPDLKGVTKRRKAAWLKKMIQDPATMLKKDPIAKKLLKEYNNVPMVNMGLTNSQVNSIIRYLKSQDKSSKKKK